MLQDINTSNPSSRYKGVKKLLGSVENHLHSLLEKTLGTSLTISAHSLLQGSLFSHIADPDLRGEHLVLEYTISIRDKNICIQILIDIGASGYAFISASFVQTNDLSLTLLSTFISLKTFDGRLVVSFFFFIFFFKFYVYMQPFGL